MKAGSFQIRSMVEEIIQRIEVHVGRYGVESLKARCLLEENGEDFLENLQSIIALSENKYGCMQSFDEQLENIRCLVRCIKSIIFAYTVDQRRGVDKRSSFPLTVYCLAIVEALASSLTNSIRSTILSPNTEVIHYLITMVNLPSAGVVDNEVEVDGNKKACSAAICSETSPSAPATTELVKLAMTIRYWAGCALESVGYSCDGMINFNRAVDVLKDSSPANYLVRLRLCDCLRSLSRVGMYRRLLSSTSLGLMRALFGLLNSEEGVILQPLIFECLLNLGNGLDRGEHSSPPVKESTDNVVGSSRVAISGTTAGTTAAILTDYINNIAHEMRNRERRSLSVWVCCQLLSHLLSRSPSHTECIMSVGLHEELMSFINTEGRNPATWGGDDSVGNWSMSLIMTLIESSETAAQQLARVHVTSLLVPLMEYDGVVGVMASMSMIRFISYQLANKQTDEDFAGTNFIRIVRSRPLLVKRVIDLLEDFIMYRVDTRPGGAFEGKISLRLVLTAMKTLVHAGVSRTFFESPKVILTLNSIIELYALGARVIGDETTEDGQTICVTIAVDTLLHLVRELTLSCEPPLSWPPASVASGVAVVAMEVEEGVGSEEEETMRRWSSLPGLTAKTIRALKACYRYSTTCIPLHNLCSSVEEIMNLLSSADRTLSRINAEYDLMSKNIVAMNMLNPSIFDKETHRESSLFQNEISNVKVNAGPVGPAIVMSRAPESIASAQVRAWEGKLHVALQSKGYHVVCTDQLQEASSVEVEHPPLDHRRLGARDAALAAIGDCAAVVIALSSAYMQHAASRIEAIHAETCRKLRHTKVFYLMLDNDVPVATNNGPCADSHVPCDDEKKGLDVDNNVVLLTGDINWTLLASAASARYQIRGDGDDDEISSIAADISQRVGAGDCDDHHHSREVPGIATSIPTPMDRTELPSLHPGHECSSRGDEEPSRHVDQCSVRLSMADPPYDRSLPPSTAPNTTTSTTSCFSYSDGNPPSAYVAPVARQFNATMDLIEYAISSDYEGDLFNHSDRDTESQKFYNVSPARPVIALIVPRDDEDPDISPSSPSHLLADCVDANAEIVPVAMAVEQFGLCSSGSSQTSSPRSPSSCNPSPRTMLGRDNVANDEYADSCSGSGVVCCQPYDDSLRRIAPIFMATCEAVTAEPMVDHHESSTSNRSSLRGNGNNYSRNLRRNAPASFAQSLMNRTPRQPYPHNQNRGNVIQRGERRVAIPVSNSPSYPNIGNRSTASRQQQRSITPSDPGYQPEYPYRCYNAASGAAYRQEHSEEVQVPIVTRSSSGRR